MVVEMRVVMPLMALAVSLFVSGSSFAESRLFSAHASRAGVTIVSATRNGAQLPVAGQEGAETFFRIDASGPVPCQNDLAFVASTGQRVAMSVDLCAASYNVTVAVAGGGAAPAAPVVADESQQMAIATDDPNVTISKVFISGKEVPIDTRADPYVEVTLPPVASGDGCSRDLGLALSDSRRIARLVNVCATSYVVVVPLAGGAPPPPPPPSMTPSVSPMVEPMTQPETAMEPVPSVEPVAPVEPDQPMAPEAPAFVDNMQWLFSATGEGGALSYALPNSDGGEFSAVCTTGSRSATVTLNRGAPELAPGARVPVRIVAGAFDASYTATGSAVSDADGLSHPVLKLPTSDPVWGALIRERAVSFMVGSAPTYGLSLSGSAVKVKQFLATCDPPPLVEEMPQPGPGPAVLLPVPPAAIGGGRGYTCRDGGTIGITFNRNTAMVTEGGGGALRLYRSNSPYGPRYTSGLSELIVQGGVAYWTREGRPQRVCSPN